MPNPTAVACYSIDSLMSIYLWLHTSLVFSCSRKLYSYLSFSCYSVFWFLNHYFRNIFEKSVFSAPWALNKIIMVKSNTYQLSNYASSRPKILNKYRLKICSNLDYKGTWMCPYPKQHILRLFEEARRRCFWAVAYYLLVFLSSCFS